jgi:ribosomal protein L35
MRQARYERTEKGKATARRYAQTEKGKVRRRAVFWRHYQRADRAAFLARFRSYYYANRERLLARQRERYRQIKATVGSWRFDFWRNQVRHSE